MLARRMSYSTHRVALLCASCGFGLFCVCVCWSASAFRACLVYASFPFCLFLSEQLVSLACLMPAALNDIWWHGLRTYSRVGPSGPMAKSILHSIIGFGITIEHITLQYSAVQYVGDGPYFLISGGSDRQISECSHGGAQISEPC